MSGPRVFHYGFWTVHSGFAGVVLACLAIAIFAVAQQLRLGIPTFGLAMMIGVIFAPLMLLNLLADYLNRSRFGTIHASSAGIEFHRFDGKRVTIDWNELRRIEPISIGTLDFIAGRGRGGIRLVSDHARVPVFRQIRGFDELLRLVRDATGATGDTSIR